MNHCMLLIYWLNKILIDLLIDPLVPWHGFLSHCQTWCALFSICLSFHTWSFTIYAVITLLATITINKMTTYNCQKPLVLITQLYKTRWTFTHIEIRGKCTPPVHLTLASVSVGIKHFLVPWWNKSFETVRWLYALQLNAKKKMTLGGRGGRRLWSPLQPPATGQSLSVHRRSMAKGIKSSVPPS